MATMTLAMRTTHYSPHDEGDLILVHGAEAGRVVVGLGGAARGLKQDGACHNRARCAHGISRCVPAATTRVVAARRTAFGLRRGGPGCAHSQPTWARQAGRTRAPARALPCPPQPARPLGRRGPTSAWLGLTLTRGPEWPELAVRVRVRREELSVGVVGLSRAEGQRREQSREAAQRGVAAGDAERRRREVMQRGGAEVVWPRAVRCRPELPRGSRRRG
eukprot:scaffold63052_cov66-Phaeocystis_antarctica.AAC.2